MRVGKRGCCRRVASAGAAKLMASNRLGQKPASHSGLCDTVQRRRMAVTLWHKMIKTEMNACPPS